MGIINSKDCSSKLVGNGLGGHTFTRTGTSIEVDPGAVLHLMSRFQTPFHKQKILFLIESQYVLDGLICTVVENDVLKGILG